MTIDDLVFGLVFFWQGFALFFIALTTILPIYVRGGDSQSSPAKQTAFAISRTLRIVLTFALFCGAAGGAKLLGLYRTLPETNGFYVIGCLIGAWVGYSVGKATINRPV